MVKKIVHLTSVHPRNDVRIYVKEVASLGKLYSASLVVADGKGDSTLNEIVIYDVGAPKTRLDRVLKTTKQVLKKALQLDADLYHLHDPELLLIASKLLKAGKKVVFDAHEDFPKQLLSKPYLKKWLARLLYVVAAWYEKKVCCKLSGIVTATETIKSKFIKINPRTVAINNYPLLEEFIATNVSWDQKKNQVCYIGAVSEIRGIFPLLDAMRLLYEEKFDCQLVIAGPINGANFKEEVLKKLPPNVEYLGVVTREEVKVILSRSIAGIVTFLPSPNHIDSQPNKIFEYMSAGLPVIGSDFPLWKRVLIDKNCGFCVNPHSSKDIAAMIKHLLLNRLEAEKVGANGRSCVDAIYNWPKEEQKLLEFYRELLI